MRNQTLAFLAASVLLVVPTGPVAHAGKAEAKACAQNLSKDGKVILKTVGPRLQKNKDNRAIFRKTVGELASAGKISRLRAKKNAMAVGECLKLARE